MASLIERETEIVEEEAIEHKYTETNFQETAENKEAVVELIKKSHKFINEYMQKLMKVTEYDTKLKKCVIRLQMLIDRCCTASVLWTFDIDMPTNWVTADYIDCDEVVLISEEVKTSLLLALAACYFCSDLMETKFGDSDDQGANCFIEEIVSDFDFQVGSLIANDDHNTFGKSKLTEELKNVVVDWYNFEK